MRPIGKDITKTLSNSVQLNELHAICILQAHVCYVLIILLLSAKPLTDESLPLDAIEAIYPKLGTYRNESLSIWETFSEEKKRKAIGFVQAYISQTPNVIDQMYLNRYLKAEPWEN